MKVFSVPLRFTFFPVCAAIGALFSGCATVTKPAPQATPTQATAPVKPESKKQETPPATVMAPPPVVPPPAPSPVPARSTVTPAVAAPLPEVMVRHATIKGSQESSILLDNFTAFVTAIDGRKVEAGRAGWNVPLEIETGRRVLNVEFNRGVFRARGRLEFEAVANARYELKYATDAELFGNNSYCNFWVVDAQTGQTMSMLSKASVEKVAEAPKPSLLP